MVLANEEVSGAKCQEGSRYREVQTGGHGGGYGRIPQNQRRYVRQHRRVV